MNGMPVLLILFAAVLFCLFLIAPGKRCRKAAPALTACRFFAHRGLHGEGVPENSPEAFRLAAEAGYGIEMDARLTRDGGIVIHHDDSALRLCGEERLIADLTLEEARHLRLSGTEQRLPTLAEVCDLVAGRVPLLIEMKTGPYGSRLAEALYRQMRDYQGPWYVESFDPRLLLWFRRHAPHILRGQLARDAARSGIKGKRFERFLSHLLLNFLSRPDFIAYGFEGIGNPACRLIRRLFHPVLAVWTIKTKEDSRRLLTRCELQIFEGFRPDSYEKEIEP